MLGETPNDMLIPLVAPKRQVLEPDPVQLNEEPDPDQLREEPDPMLNMAIELSKQKPPDPNSEKPGTKETHMGESDKPLFLVADPFGINDTQQVQETTSFGKEMYFNSFS